MSQDDHDKIIVHETEIGHLCNLVKDLIAKIDDTHDKMFIKIDKKTDGVTFRWVAGILITILILLAGQVGFNRTLINDNQKDLSTVFQKHERERGKH